MYKCEVRIPFEDLKEGVARKAGDTFTCDDERALYLQSIALVWAGQIEDKPVEKKSRKK